jgi:hypothetical protein
MTKGRCRLGDINYLCIPYFGEADELLLAQAIHARGGIMAVAEIAFDLSKDLFISPFDTMPGSPESIVF